MKKRLLIATAILLGSSAIVLGVFTQAHAAVNHACIVSAKNTFMSSLKTDDTDYTLAMSSSSAALTTTLHKARGNNLAIKTARTNYQSEIINARMAFIAAREAVAVQLKSARKSCGA